MNPLVRTSFLVFVIVAVAAGLVRPVAAKPDGKTSTSEIVAGAGAVAYLLAYESALVRSKGSRAQAEAVMQAPLPPLATPAAGGVAPRALDLRTLRTIVVLDAAIAAHRDAAGIPAWRGRFENFRACWNATIAAVPTTSPSPSPSASATPTAKATAKPATAAARVLATTASPAPSATATPPSCDAVLDDIATWLATPAASVTSSPAVSAATTLAVSYHLDRRDLADALAHAPSLMQQISDANVGSFATANYVRALFLQTAAEEVAVAMLPTPAPAPTGRVGMLDGGGLNAAFDTLKSIAKDCGSTLSAWDCITDVGTIEASFASSQVRRDACAWARSAYLPAFTDVSSLAEPDAPLRDRRWQGVQSGWPPAGLAQTIGDTIVLPSAYQTAATPPPGFAGHVGRIVVTAQGC